MPFINVKTNQQISNNIADKIKADLGQAITAVPGKSEGWLMVGIEDEYRLWFKGSDDPCAIVEVSLYGNAPAMALSLLTGKITDTLTEYLPIPSDRIYVSYFPTGHWGWNGNNF
ncbi:MAG: hypothetical protein IJM87_00580 [Ruminococcus sp.]|nr:hypothetical protein [Ruminococcus sp.]